MKPQVFEKDQNIKLVEYGAHCNSFPKITFNGNLSFLNKLTDILSKKK